MNEPQYTTGRAELETLKRERDRLRFLARRLELDLRTVIEVARLNLPRAHGVIERIAATLDTKEQIDQ
jgi:hypothetical protein